VNENSVSVLCTELRQCKADNTQEYVKLKKKYFGNSPHTLARKAINFDKGKSYE